MAFACIVTALSSICICASIPGNVCKSDYCFSSSVKDAAHWGAKGRVIGLLHAARHSLQLLPGTTSAGPRADWPWAWAFGCVTKYLRGALYERRVMQGRWCMQGDWRRMMQGCDAGRMMQGGWCREGDACRMMQGGWCKEDYAWRLMQGGWCREGDAGRWVILDWTRTVT